MLFSQKQGQMAKNTDFLKNQKVIRNADKLRI